MHKDLNESKKFILRYLLIVLLGLGLLSAVSIYIQPLEGDLTRMGGYAERDFGWNIPQEALNQNVRLNHSYEKYYDIVVLGDSFSKQGLWQSYFTEHNGLSFTTLSWDNTTVDDIINNPIFKNDPPRLFIVEVGVRLFPLRFYSDNTNCNIQEVAKFNANWNLAYKAQNNLFEKRIRDTSVDLSKINLKFSLLYLENSVLRLIFNTDFSKVNKYSLTRNDLFSNLRSSEVLLLQTWFDSKVWKPDEISSSICAVGKIQSIVQANGKTIFVLMPIPDKGSAYSDYIISPEFTMLKDLFLQLKNSNIHTPKLDIAIKKAIDSGERDIYLPNDTHFGSKGYQLTANTLHELLLDLGVNIN